MPPADAKRSKAGGPASPRTTSRGSPGGTACTTDAWSWPKSPEGARQAGAIGPDAQPRAQPCNHQRFQARGTGAPPQRLSQLLSYPLSVLAPSSSSCSHLLMTEAVKFLWLGHGVSAIPPPRPLLPGPTTPPPGPSSSQHRVSVDPHPGTHRSPSARRWGLAERKPHRRGCAGCGDRPGG